MANVLKFALGLDTAQFAGAAKHAEEMLNNITHAAKGGGGSMGNMFNALKDFAGAVKTGSGALGGAGGVAAMATGFGAALAAVQAIEVLLSSIADLAENVGRKLIAAAEHGAQLYYLAHRTQTGVGALYGLQRGAQAAGLSEDAPMGMMLKLQRALSGVSEEGERTDATFAALNLNMDEMRRMAPEKQLLSVAHALHSANASARAGFASNLFGRFGYGDMLQLANQIETVQREWAKADPGGQLYAKTGEAFAMARTQVYGLKSDVEIMFASAAQYLVVPFKDMIEALRSFPWKETGEIIGLALKPLAELLRFYANAHEIAHNPGNWLDRRKADYKQASDDAFAQPPDKREEARGHNLRALLGNLILGMPGTLFGGTQIGQPDPSAMGAMNYKPQSNAFEKMGFIFGGGLDSTQSYMRRTAIAAEKTNEKLDRLRLHFDGHHAELRNAP